MNEQISDALAALTKRVEALEKQAVQQATAKPVRKKDWRRVAGMFPGREFMRDVDAEGAGIREAERRGDANEPHIVQ